MLNGIDIVEVPAGTEIEHEGEKLIVTDTQAVTKGRIIYMTAFHVSALKSHPSVRVEAK